LNRPRPPPQHFFLGGGHGAGSTHGGGGHGAGITQTTGGGQGGGAQAFLLLWHASASAVSSRLPSSPAKASVTNERRIESAS
jgi:hypothetical protein